MITLPDSRTDIDNVTKGDQLQGHVGIAVNKAWCIDYAGPFNTTLQATTRPQTRSVTTGQGPLRKMWICIIVDLLTRYVQAFCVPNLTTESFLNCLIQGFAIMGQPSKIFLDNQTAFVDGAKQLHNSNKIWAEELNMAEISEFIGPRNIDFVFGTPQSPWLQASAEIAVKSFKNALKKCLKTKVLSFMEMQTQLFNISAYLNTRPLAIEKVPGLEEKDQSYYSLTPNHLQWGYPGTVTNSYFESTATRQNVKTLWKERKKIAQELRAVFLQEYLANLQERNKWRKDRQRKIQIGDLLLMPHDMTDDERKRMNKLTISSDVGYSFSSWPLVRVINLIYHPRDKSLVKAVELQRCNGNYRIRKFDENGKPFDSLVLKKPTTFIRDLNGLKDLHFFNEETRLLQEQRPLEHQKCSTLIDKLEDKEAIVQTDQVTFVDLRPKSLRIRRAKQIMNQVDLRGSLQPK